VFQADLASLARSWVLRAWFVLTVLVALVVLLGHGDSNIIAQKPGGAILAALVQSGDPATGAPHTLRELLKIYIVVWVSFIIVLTGGTISSELGVVADAVLSRGISRWQYFMGKWTARLAAVLAVYALVMVPIALVLWLGTATTDPASDGVSRVEFSSEVSDPPGSLVMHHTITLSGVAFALGRVAAILAFVITCGVAFSASFDSTAISIAVGWVSIYGTGLMLSILDVPQFSPARLIRDLPDLVSGRYVASDQYWLLGGWLTATFLVSLVTGTFFSARDV
jgi:hypothetical protein